MRVVLEQVSSGTNTRGVNLSRSGQKSSAYDRAFRAVVGPSGRRIEALALVWAHEIAWAEIDQSGLDELEQLASVAATYGVPMTEVLDERTRQQQRGPVIAAPARRPAPEAATARPRLASRWRPTDPAPVYRPTTE